MTCNENQGVGTVDFLVLTRNLLAYDVHSRIAEKGQRLSWSYAAAFFTKLKKSLS